MLRSAFRVLWNAIANGLAADLGWPLTLAILLMISVAISLLLAAASMTINSLLGRLKPATEKLADEGLLGVAKSARDRIVVPILYGRKGQRKL
jgi:hypothetical protein